MKDKPTPGDAARQRRNEGHSIHMVAYESRMRVSDGPAPEFADLVEAIEAEGWTLYQVFQGLGKLYLLFRRDRNQ